MDIEDPAETPPMNTPDTGTGLMKTVRRVVVFILGMSVVIVGLLMVFLPGPATVVIPAGLAILATEFLWARRWLNYMKRRARDVVEWSGVVPPSPPVRPDPSVPPGSVEPAPLDQPDPAQVPATPGSETASSNSESAA